MVHGPSAPCSQYVEDHRTEDAFSLKGVPAPDDLVDYVFPHFCGIMLVRAPDAE